MNESHQTTPLNLEVPKHDRIGKLPSTICLVVGILLFLLPFAEVKCNGNTLVDNTGLGMAMGSEWKVSEKGLFGNDLFDGSVGENMKGNNRKQDPNIFAIVALALGVIALLLSFFTNRGAITGVMVSSFLTIGALIGLLIDIKDKSKLAVGEYPKENQQLQMKITVDFTSWYYITCLLFVVVAIISLQRLKYRR